MMATWCMHGDVCTCTRELGFQGKHLCVSYINWGVMLGGVQPLQTHKYTYSLLQVWSRSATLV